MSSIWRSNQVSNIPQDFSVIVKSVLLKERNFIFRQRKTQVKYQPKIGQVYLLAVGEDVTKMRVEVNNSLRSQKVNRCKYFIRPLAKVGIRIREKGLSKSKGDL